MGVERTVFYEMVTSEDVPLTGEGKQGKVRLILPAGTLVRRAKALAELRLPRKWDASRHLCVKANDKTYPTYGSYSYTVTDMTNEEVRVLRKMKVTVTSTEYVTLTEPIPQADLPGAKKTRTKEPELPLLESPS